MIFNHKVPGFDRIYEINQLGVKVIDENKNTIIECEPYSSRIVIWSHMLATCIKNGFNPDSIVIKKDNELYSSDGIVHILTVPEDKDKEEYLAQIFLNSINNQDSVSLGEIEAKRFGVMKAFELITRIVNGEF